MTNDQFTSPAERGGRRAHASAAAFRILVADADDDTRALYHCAFAAIGCDIVEASDGRDALVKALSRSPRLVITEMTLPFLDGCALCEILRRDRATADTPILMVTAEVRRAQIERARTAGADLVLVKPISLEHLVGEACRLATAVRPHRPISPRTDRNGWSSEPDPQPSRRLPQVKAFSRFTTTTPPASPESLLCPSCADPLVYVESHVGGVSARCAEQWDDFCCKRCGLFQFRRRTRSFVVCRSR